MGRKPTAWTRELPLLFNLGDFKRALWCYASGTGGPLYSQDWTSMMVCVVAISARRRDVGAAEVRSFGET